MRMRDSRLGSGASNEGEATRLVLPWAVAAAVALLALGPAVLRAGDASSAAVHAANLFGAGAIGLQEDEDFWEDDEFWYEDFLDEEEYYTEEDLGELEEDDYGAFYSDYDWDSEDEWFDDWYGDADEGWNDDWF